MIKLNAFVLSVILFANLSLQAQVWQQTNGPLGGSIQSIVAINGNLFTATDGGGVFLSTDNGNHWSLKDVGLTNLRARSLLAIGTTLFVGTYGGGVFTSTDSGISWSAVNKGLTETFINALLYSGIKLFAACDNGKVFSSTNNGISWTSESNGLPSSAIRAIVANGVNLFVATSGGGVYLSPNSGASWVPANTGLNNYFISTLLSTSTYVYAGMSDGVYRTSDNGASWTAVNTGLSGQHVYSLAKSGTNLYAGTIGGGVFMAAENTLNWSEQNMGLGTSGILCFASNDPYLYAGTDGGGIYRWTDVDGSWTRVNSGLISTIPTAFLVTSSGRLYAATEGCGTFVTYDNGTTWSHSTNSWDENHVQALAYDGNYYYEGTSNGIYRSSNASSWSNLGGSNSVNVLFADGNNLFAGTADGVIFSTDYSATWTAANSGFGTNTVNSFVRIGNSLFAGTWYGGVFRSTNNGTSWTAVNSGLSDLTIGCLAISPVSDGTGGTNLFAGTGGGIYRSTDNGTSWTSVGWSYLTNTYITSLAVSGVNLFAGTGSGMFVSTDNGTSWSPSGLTDMWVTALAVDGTNLYAGTLGSGVWRLSLSNGATGQNVLIAHYPLNSTPNDTIGNFGPMTLTNTPYQEGGIYCNGLYIYSGQAGGCEAETPIFPASIFQSFIVTANFKVTSYPSTRRPVLVGGYDYRWIGFYLEPDSTAALYYNGFTQRSTLHYSLNTWHEAKIIYDSSVAIANIYLDKVLACSARFTIVHGSDDDRTFMITNFGNGAEVFEGILSNLKIYSITATPTSVQNNTILRPEIIQVLQNYPNPFNSSTTIDYQLSENSYVTLTIYDVLGRKVATLVNQQQAIGVYNVKFEAANLSSGIYFYKIDAVRNNNKEFTSIKKLMLLK